MLRLAVLEKSRFDIFHCTEVVLTCKGFHNVLFARRGFWRRRDDHISTAHGAHKPWVCGMLPQTPRPTCAASPACERRAQWRCLGREARRPPQSAGAPAAGFTLRRVRGKWPVDRGRACWSSALLAGRWSAAHPTISGLAAATGSISASPPLARRDTWPDASPNPQPSRVQTGVAATKPSARARSSTSSSGRRSTTCSVGASRLPAKVPAAACMHTCLY